MEKNCQPLIEKCNLFIDSFETELIASLFPNRKFILRIEKLIKFPFVAITEGWNASFRGPMPWAVGIFCSMVFMTIFGMTNLANDKNFILFFLSFLLVVLIYITLVPPSFYNSTKKTKGNIELVKSLLEKENFQSSAELQLFKNSCIRNYEQTFSRITKFKWIVAAIWAILLFFLSKFTDAIISGNTEIAQGLITTIFWVTTILVFVAYPVFGYEAFIKKLHYIMLCGFDEAEYCLTKKQSISPN